MIAGQTGKFPGCPRLPGYGVVRSGSPDKALAPLSGNKVGLVDLVGLPGLLRQRGKAGEYAVKNRQSFRNLPGADGAWRHHVNAVFHHKGQQTGFS